MKITDEMNAAGCKVDREFHHCQADRIDAIFMAMLAAHSPAVPIEVVPEPELPEGIDSEGGSCD